MIRSVKINNVKCGALPRVEPEDTRPIRGGNVIPILYGNIYLVARKNSGKTAVIYQLIKHCADSNTNIIAFCATLNKDDGWMAIRRLCEKKHIPFLGFTSLKDDGVDQLQALTDMLTGKIEPTEPETKEIEAAPSYINCLPAFETKETKTEVKEHKKRRSKYVSPEYMIIMDDLSDELKSKSIPAFLKMHRHFKTKSIVSSQYLNDLAPASIKQMDIIILFANQADKKLKEIYKQYNIWVEYDTFERLYKAATSEPYSFLYIDVKHNKFRKNFNVEFII